MKPGSVSTAALAPVIAPLIKQRFPESGIQGLADRSGVDWKNIEVILTEAREGVEFNTADRILCALGSPMAWHSPELSDVYMNVDLSWIRCVCPGCETVFRTEQVGNRTPKSYCSRGCVIVASKIRRGVMNKRKPANRRDTTKACRRGHIWTDESTLVAANGRKQCRICVNLNRAKRRRKAKENMRRDLRDPTIVGERLLGMRECNPDVPIEVIADLDGLPAPDWTGDGFMSANPADHHSGTSQADNERIKARS